MYRVLFLCRSRPNEDYQGKGVYDDIHKAKLWAIALQQGTKGQAIVLDASGAIVFQVG